MQTNDAPHPPKPSQSVRPPEPLSPTDAAISTMQQEAVHVLCGAALRQGLLGRGFVTVEAKGLIAGKEVITSPCRSWLAFPHKEDNGRSTAVLPQPPSL